jgi:histidyl-tRNA synthetase
MENLSTKPVRGMQDFLPLQQLKRDYVTKIIKKNYKSFGFMQIETPALEYISRIKNAKYAGENEKLIFEIVKRGIPANTPIEDAIDLALRYDLTFPLSRFYANNRAQLPKVFKSLQIGNVWRAERPQKYRYRQFTQCDVDIIGEYSNIAEIELIIATLTTLKLLGFKNLTLLINDRQILIDILNKYNVPLVALITIDKLDKIGKNGVLNILKKNNIKSAEYLINDIINYDFNTNNKFVSNLIDIKNNVQSIVPDVNIVLDTSLVRGMGYYTGPIFEIKISDIDLSVAGGGRYNKMIGNLMQSNSDYAAVGFSIGFERIVNLVTIPKNNTKKIAILYSKTDNLINLLNVQNKYRQMGYIASLIKKPSKLKSAFFESLIEYGFTEYYNNNVIKKF